MKQEIHNFAVAVPRVHLGHPMANANEILLLCREAAKQGCELLCFPELSLTGYTCGDLFRVGALLDRAEAALEFLLENLRESPLAAWVGMPLRGEAGLYDAAVLLQGGRILACVARKMTALRQGIFTPFPPNGRDVFRWKGGEAAILPEDTVFCGILEYPFAVRLGAERMRPESDGVPSASVTFRMAACLSSAWEEPLPEKTGGNGIVPQGSGLSICSFAGYGESSGEGVYEGGAWIASAGRLFASCGGFSRRNRLVTASVEFSEKRDSVTGAPFLAQEVVPQASLPFLPADADACVRVCRKALRMQAYALAGRVESAGSRRLVLGLSGGLDSTIAILVCAECCDILEKPRSFILALTMPGMGTSGRTRGNAWRLAEAVGAELREVDIRPAVLRHFEDIGHDVENHNVVYENAQARERTQILMDMANEEGGLLVGTGDLSEIALGWCTYNGDHMSMYGVNCGVPKTVLRQMAKVEAARHGGVLAEVLLDIHDTPVSPELLPGGQETEDIIGDYDLHDFFLWHFLNAPQLPAAAVQTMAEKAFGDRYSPEKIAATMKIFLRRFFTQQFKRNAAPDGPRIFPVSLSAKSGWRMPSDADVSWLWQNGDGRAIPSRQQQAAQPGNR